MLKAFIEKILEQAVIEHYFTADGREFTSKKMVPVEDPGFPLLKVNTLKGLVDYLKSGFDGEEIGCDPTRVALHITSPTVVQAFLPVSGPWRERDQIITAKWDQMPFPFESWLSQEDFVIKLLAMFKQDEDLSQILDVAGKICCEDKAEIVDDGVTQAVTYQRGVKKESGKILPLRPRLRPVRTFTEVEQPASEFVFRLRSEPVMLALFEADMGAWEMVAKQNIKAYLETELPGIPVFM